MDAPHSATLRNPRRELSTWQEIADYLHVSVRTAQIWERQQGLPIHRLKGEKPRVWAFSDELDSWRGNGAAAGLAPQRRRRLWPWGLAVVLLAASGAIAVYLLTLAGAAVRFETAGPVLTAFDARGRQVWRYSLPAVPIPVSESNPNHAQRNRGLFTDLKDDGRPELLYTLLPKAAGAPGGTLLCIGQNGKLLWSYRPGRPVASIDGTEYSPIWDMAFVAALRRPRSDGGRIVVASHHLYDWPAKAAVLDSAGKVVAEHWHPGWLITGLLHDLDGDGQEEILLGGINDSYQKQRAEASLLVLDADFSTGQSAPARGDNRQIAGVPVAAEASLVLFPKRPYPGAAGRTWFVQSIDTEASAIEVKVAAQPGSSTQQTGLHYRFDHRLNCTGLTFDHTFDGYFAEGLPPLSPGTGRSRQVTAALMDLLVPRNRFAERGK